MALIPAPATPIATAVLAPWHPGQSRLEHLSGGVTVISRGTQAWRGTFSFAPAGSANTARAKSLASWLWRMQGGVNTSDIPLPKQFRPSNPPSGLAATFTAFAAGVMTIAATPSYTPAAGDFLSVGGRLYHVESATGASVTVTPDVDPGASSGAVVQLLQPVVRIRLTGAPSVGQRGSLFSETTVEWQEAV